ncbi:hypothetical protein BHM03_00054386 [Ensete ventricosum]|nr:hypothetical protein BHM03_00054386 [Ensete ventricosum]
MFLLLARGEETSSPREARASRRNVPMKPRREARAERRNIVSSAREASTTSSRLHALVSSPTVTKAYSPHEASLRLLLPASDGSGSSRESNTGSPSSPFSSSSSSFSLSRYRPTTGGDG